jgi:hypothetical protein
LFTLDFDYQDAQVGVGDDKIGLTIPRTTPETTILPWDAMEDVKGVGELIAERL